MSYRCEVCRTAVPPGRPRLVHRLTRSDGSTARELAVCPGCQRALAAGASLAELAVQFQAAAEAADCRVVEVAVPPPPLPPPPVLGVPVRVGRAMPSTRPRPANGPAAPR